MPLAGTFPVLIALSGEIDAKLETTERMSNNSSFQKRNPTLMNLHKSLLPIKSAPLIFSISFNTSTPALTGGGQEGRTRDASVGPPGPLCCGG